MDHSTYYKQVYDQDTPHGESHGWIQWKGTEVCIDLHCVCGHHGHVDEDFFYHYRCPACKAVFAVGAVVKLIPLTPEQLAYVERDGRTITTCELEDES